jgi:hypothetical protein
MIMPRLDFLTRYIVRSQDDRAEPTGTIPRHVLMTPHRTLDATTLRRLSETARSEGSLEHERSHRKLPRIENTRAIIEQYQMRQPIGTAKVSATQPFPYSLRAVSFVNPWQILYRQGRLTSEHFELVP